jgi:hypothetical protein
MTPADKRILAKKWKIPPAKVDERLKPKQEKPIVL